MKQLLLLMFTCLILTVQAQKKVLDHSVYDGWQSIAERDISNDGKYIVYAVNPQEGDGAMYIKGVGNNYKQIIPRGYSLTMTYDSRFAICRIRPYYKEIREAKIKKKRPDDMPKDSLVIVELGKPGMTKIANIKSYKVPDESGIWLAYLLEKPAATGKPKTSLDSAGRLNSMLAMADSLVRVADSIRNKANDARTKGLSVLQGAATKTTNNRPGENSTEGTVLVLLNLQSGQEQRFELVTEYFFSRKGFTLAFETTRKNGDTNVVATVKKLNLVNNNLLTVFKRFNEAKGYRMDETGQQLAFVAERDSSKLPQKFYKLYYHKDGMDSAGVLADMSTKGMPSGWTVSDNPNISFSKSGNRLFFGNAPILPAKDTSLPEIDRVSVDIWHYNDDYIQPLQLKNLTRELNTSYAARFDFENKTVIPLASKDMRTVLFTQEGDGDVFYGAADGGNRIAAQWQGYTLNDIYAIHPTDGVKEIIVKKFKGGSIQPSYTGKYLLLFDEIKKTCFAYNAETKQMVQVAKDIKSSLFDELNDVPDDPNSYGIVKWTAQDQYVLIYDRYDIWQVDPEGKEKSFCLTDGSKDKIIHRYVNTNPDEKFLKTDQTLLLRLFDEKDKTSGIATWKEGEMTVLFKEPVNTGFLLQKAKNADVLSYTKESYQQSPDVYVQVFGENAQQLSHTNLQQADYNWGSAELFKWKAYTGKEAEGIIYKPENFDPKKKYPMIVYFYERSNQTLHNYIAPSPTPSRLNISFFVSRGYVVFVPDIWYKKGYPGQGAFDYIVSGTRAVVKQGYVDSTKMGLQGQSWGGYQIAYLITKTNLYAAAWAGAPVVNMTSAYGGVRWGSGMNRQFQYEKTQSRIGASLWERQDLYIANSPLFSLPKVKTPLVIMANDADGAVPWYQGIEYFTAMRRLGKKVWMLNYNNEDHNLVERKNRKDIQIREQQFFDYLLKGDKPAKWITDGVPATMKGRDLGLGDE